MATTSIVLRLSEPASTIFLCPAIFYSILYSIIYYLIFEVGISPKEIEIIIKVP